MQVAGCRFLILAFGFWLLASSSFAQVASFTASPTAGCPPRVVQFTNLSTGATTYTWTFGDGTATSTQTNPPHIYNSTGVYTVTLKATDSNGSTNTLVKPNYIVMYNSPTAGFTMSTDTACIGQPITFTDATVISPGGAPIGTWLWDFKDGSVPTVTTPTITHTYNNAGTFLVTMTATDPNGCKGDITHTIVIIPQPTITFTATPTSACDPPLNVTFTNTSPSAGQTYIWHFGDGSTSTATNPVHNYTASGTYNVTLIVNQSGCIDSLVKTNYIIIQKLVANFTANPMIVCTGYPVQFTNTSVPPAVTANWNFGDFGTSTLINPTHVYTTPGIYTITLIAGDASGCKDTTTTKGKVTVIQTPVASFTASPTLSCSVPFTVTFTNTSTGGTNYSWNFGDGGTSNLLNPVHTYITPGTYAVSLIVTNAGSTCINTLVKNNFIIISPPVAGFIHSLPDSGCAPLITVNFTNTSNSVDPITTYSWTFGDGNNSTAVNPSHTYTAVGVYTVTLIIQTAKGCVDTFVCSNCVKMGTPPVANFGILEDTVCYGLPVTFSDSSTGNVTGWHWYFGDGGQSFVQNPIYVYGDTGTFSVYLIAYNNGCPDSSARDTVVILPPKAAFTYTLSCTNYYTVQFMSASAGADSLFWDFGDGAQDSSNIINPVHIYLSRGPKTVTLIAYNDTTGCADTITMTFTIAEPIASYTVNPEGCYPFTANFTSTSQDANTYWWNFGDPSTALDTAIIANPSYTYNNPAAYTVTFIITDVNGCTNTLIDIVKSLGPLPYFYADTLTGCRPLVVTFVDTSYSDSILTQWIWNFGDNSPNDTTNNGSIVHIYTMPGIYSVTMTTKDTNGCIKTIVKNNYIQPTFPYPAFTVDTFACKFDVLTYNASATTVVGGTYIWNYGDGQQDTTNNPIITHAYTNDGLYIVSLTVVDINGCDSAVTDTVLILKPTAIFIDSILNLGCGTLLDSLIDLSTGYVTSWSWTFGNNGGSIQQNPLVSYTQPGFYTITLIVTNAGGCKDTATLDSVQVFGPIGTFTFTPTSGCNPLTVCFEASSFNSDSYIWDFGDGFTFSSDKDTCHTYTSAGTFNPQLLLSSALPNGDTCYLLATNLTGSVTVINLLNVSLSGSSITVPPYVVTLDEDSIISVNTIFSGGTPPYTYHWIPSTGINCDTCTSILIVGTGDTILYTFTIYDSSGCIGIDSILVLSQPCFEEKLIPNVFSPNGDGFNDVFYISGVCPEEKYSLQIFDRWGTLLFSTTQRKNTWDGSTSAGVEAKDGVYYFVVRADDTTYKGFVHLLR